VLGVIAALLLRVFATRSNTTRTILRGLRPRDFLGAITILVPVIVIAGVLIRLPVLGWGWWSAIGGQGSVVLGQSATTGSTPIATATAIAFLAAIAVLAPELAWREELAFRAGSEHRTPRQRLTVAALFGAAHLTMGIPIGAAVALAGGGLYFTRRYLAGWRDAHTRGEDPRTEALLTATRSHVAWNWTLLAVVLTLLLTG